MFLKTLANSFRLLVLIGAGAVVSACGGFDGVQLNGKVFDAMGVNTGSVSQEDAKLQARQPLVVPPKTAALPEPGSVLPPQADLAEVKDHDLSKVADQAALEKQQAEFCEKNYSLNKAIDDPSVDSLKGPLGPCHKSVFTNINVSSGSMSDN